jgi:hypothetical protein
MMRLCATPEEVLANADELAANHLSAELLSKLAHDRVLGLLSRVHAASWECPEIVAIETMEEHVVPVTNDCCGTVVKAVVADAERDHAA